MNSIYTILKQLNIVYDKYEHPALFTVKEAEKYERRDAVPSKNLFLRNKKGTKHYLVVVKAEKRVNIKDLELKLKEKNISFASPERLMNYLKLVPGSVSPFGLINDVNDEIEVIVDESLLKESKQGFHPNVNTATLIITTDDFKKFLSWTGNNITYLEI